MAFTLYWDHDDQKRYETGVDRGVLYPADSTRTTGVGAGYSKAYAWNGLSSVSENPTGAEATPIFADNIKYLNMTSKEDFEATIEAYSYPDEFEACNGNHPLTNGTLTIPGVYASQQTRNTFGLSYRTKIGVGGNSNAGYKIHLVYGCSASPSEKSYETINDSPEALTFSWDLTTVPTALVPTGMKSCAHLIIDTTKYQAGGHDDARLTAVQDVLYGVDTTTLSSYATYATNQAVSVGDRRKNSNKYYICIKAHTTSSTMTAANWIEVANDGRLLSPVEVLSILRAAS